MPIRMPLVTNGVAGSKGIMFLFRVFPLSLKSLSHLSGDPLFQQLDQEQMVSVPPLTIEVVLQQPLS